MSGTRTARAVRTFASISFAIGTLAKFALSFAASRRLLRIWESS